MWQVVCVRALGFLGHHLPRSPTAMSTSYVSAATSRAVDATLPAAHERLRQNFNAALLGIAGRTEPAAKRCIILSGGVDTCAILAAARETGVTFGGAITVLTSEDSPDMKFAVAAAAQAQLAHEIVYVTAADLIDTYLPACVKALATFDGMTLRNSLVVAAAMRKASELGFKHAVVGDGADELFGGYSFMWGMADDLPQWKAKRDKSTRFSKWPYAARPLSRWPYAAETSPAAHLGDMLPAPV